jgi:Sigma-70 region 2
MRTNAEILPFGLPKNTPLTLVSGHKGRSTVEQSSDEALMALLPDGGQDAIGCLFRRHARAIHTIGRRVLRDAAEAEDLVQEVFLYVFRKHDLYDPAKGSARSWLIQIAYTQAFLRRRKLKSLGLYEAARCLIPSLFDRCCRTVVFKLWIPVAAACGCEIEDRP